MKCHCVRSYGRVHSYVLLLRLSQPNNFTPLGIALRNERWDAVTLMLSCARIDPNTSLPPHLPPLYEACQNGRMEALTVLVAMPRVDINLPMVI